MKIWVSYEKLRRAIKQVLITYLKVLTNPINIFIIFGTTLKKKRDGHICLEVKKRL
jgi:hypothetical protein